MLLEAGLGRLEPWDASAGWAPLGNAGATPLNCAVKASEPTAPIKHYPPLTARKRPPAQQGFTACSDSLHSSFLCSGNLQMGFAFPESFRTQETLPALKVWDCTWHQWQLRSPPAHLPCGLNAKKPPPPVLPFAVLCPVLSCAVSSAVPCCPVSFAEAEAAGPGWPCAGRRQECRLTAARMVPPGSHQTHEEC